MNNANRVFPAQQPQTSQQLIGGGDGIIGGLTPINIHAVQDVLAISLLQAVQRSGSGVRESGKALAIEGSTHRAVAAAVNNGGISPGTSNSEMKISWFNSIVLLKKQFVTLVEDITTKRLVETLGGLATNELKKAAINDFSVLWRQLLDIINTMEMKISQLTFEDDVVYPNSGQLVSNLLISNVKEVEEQFLELLGQSSLRFLDTVCTVHDLQYKHLIDINYDIRQWKKNNLNHIKFTQRSSTSNQLNPAKDGQPGSGKVSPSSSSSSSFLVPYYCCCIKAKKITDTQNNTAAAAVNINHQNILLKKK